MSKTDERAIFAAQVEDVIRRSGDDVAHAKEERDVLKARLDLTEKALAMALHPFSHMVNGIPMSPEEHRARFEEPIEVRSAVQMVQNLERALVGRTDLSRTQVSCYDLRMALLELCTLRLVFNNTHEELEYHKQTNEKLQRKYDTALQVVNAARNCQEASNTHIGIHHRAVLRDEIAKFDAVAKNDCDSKDDKEQ